MYSGVKTPAIDCIVPSVPGLTPCATKFTVPTELKNRDLYLAVFLPRAPGLKSWAIKSPFLRNCKTAIVLAVYFLLRPSAFVLPTQGSRPALQNSPFLPHIAANRAEKLVNGGVHFF